MIAIHNMEKPKNCKRCIASCLSVPVISWGDNDPVIHAELQCRILHKTITNLEAVPDDCPLIEAIACDECKWQETHYNKKLKLCGHRFGMIKADGFCSYGERKEHDSNKEP